MPGALGVGLRLGAAAHDARRALDLFDKAGVPIIGTSPDREGVVLGISQVAAATALAAGIRGVSEETTTGVNRLYRLAEAGVASPVHRADYQAPAWWIDTVDLTFDLDPGPDVSADVPVESLAPAR